MASVSAGKTPDKSIKSKSRVRDLAEVYTNEREVKDMLDLVPAKVGAKTYANATFLEPACGNGNFLIEILRRKLQSIPAVREYFEAESSVPKTLPGRGKAEDIIFRALEAVSSIYGFDICANNVAETRVRIFTYVVYGKDILPHFLTGQDFYTRAYIEAVTPDHSLPLALDYEASLEHYSDSVAGYENLRDRAAAISPLLQKALKLVLAKNIQQGDFLAQTDAAGAPLTVGEWRFLAGKVLRSDYRVADLELARPPVAWRMPACSLTAFVNGGGHA